MDELLKRLLVEIVINADDALSDIKNLRSATEQLKAEFKDLQAKTGESFGLIQASVKKTTLDPLKNAIKETKMALAGLNAELRALGPTKFAGVEAPSSEQQALLNSIAAKQAELVTLQQQLSIATRASTAAFSELKRESAQVKAPILSAKDAAIQFTTNVSIAKNEMLSMVRAGIPLKSAMAGLAQTGQYSSRELSEAFRQTKKELTDTTPKVDKFGEAMGKAGRIIERVFAAAIIGFALGAIRRLSTELKEIINEGREFTQSLIELSVEVNALARTGVETSFKEWTTYVSDLRREFKSLTTEDLNDGIAMLIRLQRQTGMSSEEIRRFGNDLAVLAVTKGKQFVEVIDDAQNAVEKGLTRGLTDQVGVLDNTTVALEAVARGYAETTAEVGAYERMLTVMEIVQEAANEVSGESAAIQKETVTQLADLEEKIATTRKAIGQDLVPITLLWKGALSGVWEIIRWLAHALTYLLAPAIALVLTHIITFKHALDALKDGELINYLQEFKENFIAIQDVLIRGMDFEGLEMGVGGIGRAFEAAGVEVEAAADKIGDAIFKIQEMAISLENAIAKELRSFENQVAADAAKFALKMQQLVQKLQFDIAKTNRQFNDKVAEANDDYRDNEVKAEEDYQEKLRKLREQFLFNLEDALRERDARQIIRLIREYNLKRDQLNRERVLEQEDNKRKLEDQISDLRAQRDARIRELELEAQFRSSQMQAQFALEQELRRKQHEQRVAEMRISAKERLDAFLRELVKSGDLTIEEARLIAGAFDMFFGPGGQIEGSISYLTELLQVAAVAAIQAINRIKAAIAGVFSISKSMSKGFDKGLPPGSVEIPSGIGAAEGGSFLVTRPTQFVAGDAGPEVAQFTPLKREGRDVNTLFSDVGVGRRNTNPSRVVIGLEDGLIANIVDSAVGAAGNVIIDIQRVER